MSQVALLAGSLAAVLLLALAAHLLRLGGARLADEAEARDVAEASFADFEAERIWLDIDGQAAVVRSKDGSLALVRRHGARFLARKAPVPAQASAQGSVVIVASGERLLKPFVITLASADEARLLTSLLGSAPPDG